MSSILFENRKKSKNTAQLFLLSIIPFSYGVLMEILQFALTISRTASLTDIIANSSGILISLLFWLWLKPYKRYSVK
jgi:VanZ family protein